MSCKVTLSKPNLISRTINHDKSIMDIYKAKELNSYIMSNAELYHKNKIYNLIGEILPFVNISNLRIIITIDYDIINISTSDKYTEYILTTPIKNIIRFLKIQKILKMRKICKHIRP